MDSVSDTTQYPAFSNYILNCQPEQILLNSVTVNLSRQTHTYTHTHTHTHTHTILVQMAKLLYRMKQCHTAYAITCHRVVTWATRHFFTACPNPLILLCFQRLNIRRPVQITKSLIMQFSPASSYCAHLCPNISLTTLFFDHKVINENSHPYKEKDITSVLYTILWTF
jgi:hypothetical protein